MLFLDKLALVITSDSSGGPFKYRGASVELFDPPLKREPPRMSMALAVEVHSSMTHGYVSQ